MVDFTLNCFRHFTLRSANEDKEDLFYASTEIRMDTISLCTHTRKL